MLPAENEVLGPEVDRLATLHTNACTDAELLTVWLKSHADGSAHTRRAATRRLPFMTLAAQKRGR